MTTRRLIFLFLALLASGATILLGRAWLDAERASMTVAKAPPPPVDKSGAMVLVAKGNLAVGQFVRPENLRWQPWPTNGIAANYAVSGHRKLEDFVGAVVRIGLMDGEPITDARVVKPGDRGFMAAVLQPGDRAVTVNVTPTAGLAGFVFPGDRVDLLLTLTVPAAGAGGHERRASETVLTDLRVLAVDQRVDDQKKDVIIAKLATLEVTPKQAETIAVVSELGKLSLTLRSLAQDDDSVVPPYSHTWDSEATHLLPGPADPTPAAPQVQKVMVMRGGDAKEMTFGGAVR